MTEHDLQNEIRLKLSELGYCVFRANVGKFKLTDGRFFDVGLPKGFSDLFAIKNGRIYFIEVKVKPNKPSTAQVEFLKTMCSRYGCKGGVAYSVDEALEIVEEELK